jgi:hypothetical protein
MIRRLIAFACGPALAVSAQSVPHHVAINPVLAARSPLYFQPHLPAAPGWRHAVIVDYSNAIETGTTRDRREYLFDAELMQADLWLTRDLSPEWFVTGNVALRSGHDGMLDSFLNWYHDVIGLPVPARNRRPNDTYGWTLELPDDTLDIPRARAFAGDLRLGVGRRLGRGQVVAAVTLPTATTGIAEWKRGTVSGAITASLRVLDRRRVSLDLGAAAGWTPRHGVLEPYQRATFLAGSAAFRWRVIRRQEVFATLFTQTANYTGTGFAAMDEPEVTLDFGGLLHLADGWPRLQLGMSEDLLPRGPSIDAGFRLGLHW